MRAALFVAAVLAALSPVAFAQTSSAPAAAAAPGPADWRTPDPDNVLVIDTNKGRVLVEMVPEVAPQHVARVRELALAHFYDGHRFFRVVDDFMAQTGDPLNDGTGGSDKPDLAAEFLFRRGAEMPFATAAEANGVEAGFVRTLPVMSQSMHLAVMTRDQKVAAHGLFCPGVAGMARSGDPNSANSQFFLMREAYPSLDRNYTAWGRVISGLPVVRSLRTGEPVPDPQDKMERVRLLADLPVAERPKVRVVDTMGPWFKEQVQRLRQEQGASFNPCDVEIPVEVK